MSQVVFITVESFSEVAFAIAEIIRGSPENCSSILTVKKHGLNRVQITDDLLSLLLVWNLIT